MKFKCIHTAQVYEFAEHDAKAMRAHPDYVEVLPEVKVEEKPAPKTDKKDK